MICAALHFHLTVPSQSNGTSYDEAEFAYTPHLDAQRDADLLAILPDYLSEEICFPRSSASKFYARVVECLMKTPKAQQESDGEEGDGNE